MVKMEHGFERKPVEKGKVEEGRERKEKEINKDSVEIQKFRIHLLNEERSAATIAKYSHDIILFMNFLNGKNISKELVIDYKKWLIQYYHMRSVNSMLAAVNSYLSFSGYSECRVKLLKVQRQMFCEENKELDKEEYFRLVKAAKERGKERLAMILQTLCGLGLRVSELHFVTVEAVCMGILHIYNKGKNRSMILSGKLRKQLLAYAKKQRLRTGKIFITRSGKPVDRSNLWREMKKLYSDADVGKQKIFPHNLRHLFAKTFYEMKKDVVKLADIMGHSNIETTRLYTITSGKECRQQLEALQLVL